jgi:polysaccharide export outer membrane protein
MIDCIEATLLKQVTRECAKDMRAPALKGIGRKLSQLAIIGVLSVVGCARDLAPLPMSKPGPYQLGAGDEIRMITWGEEQLTGTFKVDDNGDVAIPLLGPVRAGGLSTVQLQDAVTRGLDRSDILHGASVSIEVTTYRPIYILGEVSHPGSYPFQIGMTMVTAVAVAGGFTYRAIDSTGSVLRGNQEFRAERTSPLQPGDTVTILQRHF